MGTTVNFSLGRIALALTGLAIMMTAGLASAGNASDPNCESPIRHVEHVEGHASLELDERSEISIRVDGTGDGHTDRLYRIALTDSEAFARTFPPAGEASGPANLVERETTHYRSLTVAFDNSDRTEVVFVADSLDCFDGRAHPEDRTADHRLAARALVRTDTGDSQQAEPFEAFAARPVILTESALAERFGGDDSSSDAPRCVAGGPGALGCSVTLPSPRSDRCAATCNQITHACCAPARHATCHCITPNH